MTIRKKTKRIEDKKRKEREKRQNRGLSTGCPIIYKKYIKTYGF